MNILSGFGEGQVLQRIGARGANVKLEVVSTEKGPVTATILNDKRPVKKWKKREVGMSRGRALTLKLEGIPAGGPYRLLLECGKDKVRSGPFYVGDVWVMAGQSNMEGIGDMSEAAKTHPLVRCFSMRREWRLATDPLHVLGESPDRCHRDVDQFTVEQGEKHRRNAVKGVGVGVFFGKEMLERSGVPQGLISTAHGGTSMQQWDPALKDKGGDSLYGSMLLSVQATGQPVAGVLWYQGESDANPNDVPHYTARMRGLVAASRRDLKQPELPWFVVQLSRFYSLEAPENWNAIREQQRLLPGVVRNLETVSSIDLTMDDNIHVGSAGYKVLASRLARAADRLVYKNRKEKRPPQLKSITLNAPGLGLPINTKMDVAFDQVVGGLRAGNEPYGFTILSPQGKVWPEIHRITLHGSVARLHLGSSLPGGGHLFYGYGVMPICNITDGRGEALLPFGPVEILKPLAYLPFITTWKLTGVVASSTPLEGIDCPNLDSLETTVKTYDLNPFINEHPNWEKKSGQAYFTSQIDLPEAMKLQFLLGYDGPFRLWVDGQPFLEDLNGVNPARIDETEKTVNLAAGSHRLTVAMDINQGRAWGFYFRFRRCDVTPKQIREKSYAVPTYSV